MKSSTGLINLLERLRIKPTLDRDKDIQLAKEVMPRQYDKITQQPFNPAIRNKL